MLSTLFDATVEGTSLVPITVNTLAKKADIVLRGKVISKTCRCDSQGRIYTEVDLQVSEVWKGVAKPGQLLTIVHSGGVLGLRRSLVSNSVTYNIGEEVLTFLVWNQSRQAITLASAQGKLLVKHNAKDGQVYVSDVYCRSPHSKSKTKGAKRERLNLSLSQLKQIVERNLE
jgi:hypothetical protein